MDNNTVNNHRENGNLSPSDISEKIQLAENLLAENKLDEAEKQFKEIMALDDQPSARHGLALTYFKQEKYSTCSVILEDSLQQYPDNILFLTLYAKTLIRENLYPQALEAYKKVMLIVPGYRDEELDAELFPDN